MKWNPWPVGIICLDGKYSLMTVISATEREFYGEESVNKLRELVLRTNILRSLLEVTEVTFSGVLPGVLHRNGLRESLVERMVTVDAVTRAIHVVATLEKVKDFSVILIGGKGYIGSAIMQNRGLHVYVVEKENDWPMVQGNLIVVNVAKHNILSKYTKFFTSDTIVVNEVYPEPTNRELLLMSGCRAVYHIVGLKGWAIPSFPKAYRGGVPCCAGWQTGGEIIVKKMEEEQ